MTDHDHHDDEILHNADLPDGAVPDGVVEIVQYVAADGGMEYATRWQTGATPVSSWIGLLTMVIHDVLGFDDRAV